MWGERVLHRPGIADRRARDPAPPVRRPEPPDQAVEPRVLAPSPGDDVPTPVPHVRDHLAVPRRLTGVRPRVQTDLVRRIDVFFYGLFMDLELLRDSGVAPVNPRRAYVEDFALRIGQRATLLPAAGARAYGMLVALSHSELERLYAARGLEQYRPEAVLAHALPGPSTPALCYNLLESPRSDERNPEYAARLQRVLERLGFPPEYVASVA
jgi:hypothetical protein